MSTLRKVRTALVLCAVACLLTLGAPRASADTFTYTLSVGNANLTLCCGSGPFGTVEVNLTDSTHATITFTAASGYLLMDSSIADVQVNATSWNIGDFSFACPPTGCDGGSGSVDGFGTFNQTTNAKDGFASGVSTLSFTLTDTSGTWANAESVLTTNGNGSSHVGAHLAPTALGGACTGFASDGGPSGGTGGTSGGCTPIPEPASMGLLGTALLGAYGLLRRKLGV